MSAAGGKHRSSTASERLQKVLRVLEAAGRSGASTMDIQLAAQITDVKDALYELRSNGVEVVSEWREKPRAGKRPHRFKHHWLAKYLEPQRALPLDMGGVMEARV